MKQCSVCGKELKTGLFAKNTDVPYPSNPDVCFVCGMENKTLSSDESTDTLGSEVQGRVQAGSLPDDLTQDRAEPPASDEQKEGQQTYVIPNRTSGKSSGSNSTSKTDDESEMTNWAISTLEGLNIFAAGLCLIICVVAAVIGLSEGEGQLVYFGVLGAAAAVILWCINQVFIGIAKDLRAVRRYLKKSI